MLSEQDVLSLVELMDEEVRAPAEVEAETRAMLADVAGRALRGGMDGVTFLQLAEITFRTALAQYRYDRARGGNE